MLSADCRRMPWQGPFMVQCLQLTTLFWRHRVRNAWYAGMPFPWVNLRHGVLANESVFETNTAAVGSFTIEMGLLSRLTGEALKIIICILNPDECLAMMAVDASVCHMAPALVQPARSSAVGAGKPHMQGSCSLTSVQSCMARPFSCMCTSLGGLRLLWA